MTPSDVQVRVRHAIEVRGIPLSDLVDGRSLVAAGVNSATLIQLLSALEDEFDVDLDVERLFSAPVTLPVLEAEIVRALASA